MRIKIGGQIQLLEFREAKFVDSYSFWGFEEQSPCFGWQNSHEGKTVYIHTT